ncbi:hypothetical protein DSM21852_03700 [Methylocystis bryophila]|nr:hypothetical protein DSM21852_03700 [Methylocystis bryophila]
MPDGGLGDHRIQVGGRGETGNEVVHGGDPPSLKHPGSIYRGATYNQEVDEKGWAPTSHREDRRNASSRPNEKALKADYEEVAFGVDFWGGSIFEFFKSVCELQSSAWRLSAVPKRGRWRKRKPRLY